jgi:hypothetical protein
MTQTEIQSYNHKNYKHLQAVLRIRTIFYQIRILTYTVNKFSATFLLEIILATVCFKKDMHEPKG